MIIYIIELIFILYLGCMFYCKRISSKTFLKLSFFLMALILGLRGANVGEDTAHYISVFERIDEISWRTIFTSGTDVIYETIWSVDRSMEVGYIILNKVIRLFTSNAQWLLFIIACTTCFLFAKFIYDNCFGVFIPTYIFLCESLYMQSFNLMRQMLAIAIGIQAYTVIKKAKKHSYIRAIIIILIAFLFHKSAIVFLVLIPLWMCKNNRKTMKYTILGCVLAPFGISIINKLIQISIPRYVGYFSNNYWESNIGGVIILWILEIIIVAYIFYKYRNKDGKEAFIATTCVALYIAFEIVGLRIIAFTRVALFFRAFLIILLPYFIRYLSPRFRLIYKIVLLVMLSVLFMRYANVPARSYEFFWM